MCDTCLSDTIAELLAQYRVPSHLLRVEVTERVVMSGAERTLQALLHLSVLGIPIAIDDDGTDSSSLSYLKHLPSDELKIARTFVQQMRTDRADQAIVQSTVNMAHSLDLRVVAERVEDQATGSVLSTFGCDTVQGYYLSRPVPVQEVERWFDERNDVVSILSTFKHLSRH